MAQAFVSNTLAVALAVMPFSLMATNARAGDNAQNPSPAHGDTNVGLNEDLGWSAGDSAISHDIYFGTSQSAVNSARKPAGDVDGDGSVDILDFSILANQWLLNPGAVNPSADIKFSGKVDFADFAILTADWHLTADAAFKGNQTSTTYDPGPLSAKTKYYWRIDEVNASQAQSPWTGTVWSFTTGVATGRQTLYESATNRRYILYVPTDYDPDRPYPLIISSHGTSQNGDTEMDSTGPNNGYDNGTPTWPVLAEADDVIVACPDMTGAYGENHCASISATHLNQLASDETAILTIIDEIQGAYNIDASRILMTGFSGGGNVAHYVGLRHPEVFAAICARHGNFLPDLAPSPLPAGITNTPVYLFTGSSDTACGTTGSAGSMAWYKAQGFIYLKTDVFTIYPSNVHTTDRHHALNWFLSL